MRHPLARTHQGADERTVNPVRERIVKRLQELEGYENLTVLRAVEVGDRVYGCETPASPYEVRFIYVRPVEFYLRLEDGEKTLEVDSGDNVRMIGMDLDLCLRKMFLSDPEIFEWMSSKDVYLSKREGKELQELSASYFSPRRMADYYLRRGRHLLERETDERLTGEITMETVRTFLSLGHILEEGTPVPGRLSELIRTGIDPTWRVAVEELIRIRREGGQPALPEDLKEYFHLRAEEAKGIVDGLPLAAETNMEKLNELLMDLLLG